MKKCPYCAEDIQDAAVVCKHCNRDLSGKPSAAQPVRVAEIDPFAAYHTDIQGKKKGKLSVVGYMGVGLGVLIMLVAGATLPDATDGGQGAVLLGMIGVGVAIASYLWARR